MDTRSPRAAGASHRPVSLRSAAIRRSTGPCPHLSPHPVVAHTLRPLHGGRGRMQAFSRRQELRRNFKRHRTAFACQLAGDRMLQALDRLGALIASTKFDPHQPRVPAGQSEGGRWMHSEGSGLAGEIPIDAIASSGGLSLRQSCEAQLDSDIFQCRMVGLRSCYEQAYQRYAACLARRPIPPFNY